VTDPNSLADIAASLSRIASSLEALRTPLAASTPPLGEANAYHWDAADGTLRPVPTVSRVPIELLKGISVCGGDKTIQWNAGFVPRVAE
jgi:hypothetical protein